MTSQLARDQRESKQGRSTESQSEFQEIKAKLDARRLLAELSQSHGVIPDKYEVTKAKDGSDRIKAGTFPAPVSLGEKAVGWVESEIDAWIAAHQRSICDRLALPVNSLSAARSRFVSGSVRAAATRAESGTRRPGAVSISRA